MPIGTLASIWRYPVKSLRGESLESVEVDESGIPGDRASALFVRSGHAREGKAYRGKEHDRLHLTADAEAALKLGAERGVALERRDAAHFFDDAPISLIFDRWVDEASGYLGCIVEPERFRPNFYVRAEPGFAAGEDELDGSEIDLGAVRLRVRYPIERCVTINYHPHGQAGDPRILGFVAQQRNACMGVYCDVLVAGRVCVGDSLVLHCRA